MGPDNRSEVADIMVGHHGDDRLWAELNKAIKQRIMKFCMRKHEPRAGVGHVAEPIRYEVIVSNVGCVYKGYSMPDADRVYADYVNLSKNNIGRAAGESVTLTEQGEITKDFTGLLENIEANPRLQSRIEQYSTPYKCPTCGTHNLEQVDDAYLYEDDDDDVYCRTCRVFMPSDSLLLDVKSPLLKGHEKIDGARAVWIPREYNPLNVREQRNLSQEMFSTRAQQLMAQQEFRPDEAKYWEGYTNALGYVRKSYSQPVRRPSTYQGDDSRIPLDVYEQNTSEDALEYWWENLSVMQRMWSLPDQLSHEAHKTWAQLSSTGRALARKYFAGLKNPIYEQNRMVDESLTAAQIDTRASIASRYGREPDKEWHDFIDDVYFVQYDNLVIGIEQDGQSHT
jgi:hypothetical protein